MIQCCHILLQSLNCNKKYILSMISQGRILCRCVWKDRQMSTACVTLIVRSFVSSDSECGSMSRDCSVGGVQHAVLQWSTAALLLCSFCCVAYNRLTKIIWNKRDLDLVDLLNCSTNFIIRLVFQRQRRKFDKSRTSNWGLRHEWSESERQWQ